MKSLLGGRMGPSVPVCRHSPILRQLGNAKDLVSGRGLYEPTLDLAPHVEANAAPGVVADARRVASTGSSLIV